MTYDLPKIQANLFRNLSLVHQSISELSQWATDSDSEMAAYAEMFEVYREKFDSPRSRKNILDFELIITNLKMENNILKRQLDDAMKYKHEMGYNLLTTAKKEEV